jgi:rhodanese-related sulfurtransferase
MEAKRLILTILLGALALVLVACGGGGAGPAAAVDLQQETQTVAVGDAGSYTDVSVDGLAALMEEAEDFPLVNVHVPYEGEIEGTDLFIPYDEIEQDLDQLPADKDARIIVYCRSGGMSAQAARTLVQLGYGDVWNVDGGMIAWQKSGRTLLKQ